ncbi:peptide deformylase [Peribacillus cavernae]|uniref:Peptide deformylase n=1 Tax=Peribacillus cavernae TaxID=1674310 RepID=A0A433HHL0_9BACI|nr:peptide deformylase [Peribacillus cavernae]MDQ0220245.1 peptide deformylase [Peribacillus cavernae]RUQ27663.1 peptide deformylase [Peribacillus cavernae]
MSKFTSSYTITMKDIIKEGDPILRQVIGVISLPPSEEDKEELACMMQFLKNSQDPAIAKKYGLRAGVGLSANQIGLNKRMFVVYFTDEKGKLYEYALINPKITSTSTTMVYLPQSEGCLSVDREIQGYAPRYERIKMKAYDMAGNELNLRFKGFPAVVIQHELDHLNGIMFYDRINSENPFKLPENVEIKSI